MCDAKCAKVCLVIFNIVFLLAGLGILGVGVYGRVNKTQFDELFGASALMVVSYIMIGAGGMVVLISLAGCVGAFTQSKIMLALYFLFLLIIFIVEVTAGIIGLLNYDKVLPLVKEYTEQGIMSKYGYQDYKAFSISIDYMQSEMECCGFNGPADWSASRYYTDANTATARGSTVVPRSCCKDINMENCNNAIDATKIYNTGCANALVALGQSNLLTVGTVSIGVALIQLFGMVCTICVWKRREDDVESF